MAELVSRHFQDFQQRQKLTRIEEARKKFEDYLVPLTIQMTQIITTNTFYEERSKAIELLLKRVRTSYLELLDELGAEGRENEALIAGEKWKKGLTQQALDTLKAMGYNL